MESNSFQKFVKRFNKNDKLIPVKQIEIDNIEGEFKIHLPRDYKEFILKYGDVWTPSISSIIISLKSDIYDVQQFWKPEHIIFDKKEEWTSQLSIDLIPFASDCMGNIFAFNTADLQKQKETCDVYFYDHDYDTIEKISSSFVSWIGQFNGL